MSPIEAVIVTIVILSPVLPPIIGTICGTIWDALHPPRTSVAHRRTRRTPADRDATRDLEGSW